MTPSPGRRAISNAEVRRLDLNAAELGVSVTRLMGNAGDALATAVSRRLAKGRFALFLCGKGNNGGDGFAAAAQLQEQGRDARVVLAEPASRIQSAAARHHFARLAKGTVVRWTGRPRAEWNKAGALVDCLLGAGLEGPPRPPYTSMISWINRRHSARVPVIACDVPSGLGHKGAVQPTQTVTFHARKIGMTTANSGAIRVAKIGIPARAASDIGVGDLAAGYTIPAWDSHKGDNGIVLVVAGSTPLAGAAHFSAMAAFRTGADLVHCAVPADVAPLLRAWGPQPIVHATNEGSHLLPEGLGEIERLMDRCKAVLVGPGMGTAGKARRAVGKILAAAAKRDLPLVVDADGLDAIDDTLLRRHGHRMVLTPHAKEFLDLTGTKASRANVERYARTNGVTVLRKSSVDIVSDGQRTRECRRGHPTLTVGGTGDVLAGIVTSLLAKGAAPFEAACAASYLLKSAGEVAASLRSYGAGPIDVIEAIPAVLLRLE